MRVFFLAVKLLVEQFSKPGAACNTSASLRQVRNMIKDSLTTETDLKLGEINSLSFWDASQSTMGQKPTSSDISLTHFYQIIGKTQEVCVEVGPTQAGANKVLTLILNIYLTIYIFKQQTLHDE